MQQTAKKKNRSGKITTFIGQDGAIPQDIHQRLRVAIQDVVAAGGRTFMTDGHGVFGREVIEVCRELRQLHPDLIIEHVVSNPQQVPPDVVITISGERVYPKVDGVLTVMFATTATDPRHQAAESRRNMLDLCDTVIAYVRPDAERNDKAVLALEYAQGNGHKIVNLYQPADKNLPHAPLPTTSSCMAMGDILLAQEPFN